MSKSRLYQVWNGIRARCLKEGSCNYKHYGARGIKVLWASFEHFLSDMGPTYQRGLSIERKDNNGHYCKDNCVWANRSQQQRNKTTSELLTCNEESMVISAWSEKLGIPITTLCSRISKGWGVQRTLTTPRIKRRSKGNDEPRLQ